MSAYEGTTQGTVTFHGDTSAQFRLLWIIPNYLELKNKVKSPNYIESKSPVYVIPGKFSCTLLFYPNGPELKPSGSTTSSALFLENKGTDNVWISFEFSVLDKHFMKRYIFPYTGTSLLKPGNQAGWQDWFPSNAVDPDSGSILSNGCLQISAIGTVFTNEQVNEPIQQLRSGILKDSNFSFDASFLSTPDENSDVILSIDEEKFHVHKSILSKRSSVFEDLFQNQIQNIFVVSDISAKAFRQVLQFIYTDTFTVSKEDTICEVLKAATKYELDYLKEICQIKMIENVSMTNAVEYLCIANELSAFQLKEAAMRFISKNSSEVLRQESWKVFKSEGGELLVQLLERLMLQNPL